MEMVRGSRLRFRTSAVRRCCDMSDTRRIRLLRQRLRDERDPRDVRDGRQMRSVNVVSRVHVVCLVGQTVRAAGTTRSQRRTLQGLSGF